MRTSHKYLIGMAGLFAGALLFLSCDSGGFVKPDSGQTSTPVSIRLDSVPTNLARDDTASIRATLLDGNGAPLSGYTVSWTSTDRQVASVAPTGATQAMLVGQDQGTATITATYDQLSASTSVKVHRRPTDLVYVSGSGQAGTAGQQLPDSLVILAVDRRGDHVPGVDVDFVVTSGGGSVSPAGGLTDANGRLSTAWTLGSGATQQVQARASEAQQRVQQLKDSVVVFTATTGSVVVGLAVLPDSPTVNMGDSLQFEAMATTSDGSQQVDNQVVWQSTDTTVATVSSKGMLKSRKSGATRVIARSNNGSSMADTTQVTVASTGSTLGTLRISSPDTLRGLGDTLTLTVEARAADGSIYPNPDVQWSSLNPDIVTVDSMGRVTSKALGTALITAATLCCSSDTGVVTVVAGTPGAVTDLEAASVSGDSVTLQWTQVDDGTGQPANYAVRYGSPTISWGSASGTEVSVGGDSIGKVARYRYTGLAAGTDYQFQLISYRGALSSGATFGPLSDVVSTSTDASSTAPVASVSVTPSSATVYTDRSLQLSATLRDSAGNTLTGRTVSWSSSNTNVATVNGSGTVTGVTAGEVTITAASEGITGTSAVTVDTATQSTAMHPDEPSGMTVLGYGDGSVIQSSDGHAFGIPNAYHWYWGAGSNSLGNFQIVDDPDNPTGSGKAVRVHYNPSTGGAASTDIRLPGGPWKQVYFALRIIIEPGWEPSHKWYYLDMPNMDRTHGVIATQMDGGENAAMAMTDPAPNHGNFYSRSGVYPEGKELLIEWLWVAPSSVGAADGQAYAWINGESLISQTGVGPIPWGQSASEWVNLHLYWKCNTFTNDSYFRVREVYVSAK